MSGYANVCPECECPNLSLDGGFHPNRQPVWYCLNCGNKTITLKTVFHADSGIGVNRHTGPIGMEVRSENTLDGILDSGNFRVLISRLTKDLK